MIFQAAGSKTPKPQRRKATQGPLKREHYPTKPCKLPFCGPGAKKEHGSPTNKALQYLQKTVLKAMSPASPYSNKTLQNTLKAFNP